MGAMLLGDTGIAPMGRSYGRIRGNFLLAARSETPRVTGCSEAGPGM